jgi:hypothetical protein
MGRIHASKLKTTLKRFARKPSAALSDDPYARFKLLDGTHPWQDIVPEGSLLYPVRKLAQGKIVYFNFELAKEMGLIPRNHKKKLTRALKKNILDSFNLRIINEFDEAQNLRFHPSVIKPNKYMATRYLQLQHPDKAGRTSGDGRSIWNGCVDFNGTLWDVSSRGTGVTALAPGVVEAGKPLQTGNTDHGYGCGLADLDELYASAIMAETFHRRGINTERVLVIIDIDGTNGIGVRAGRNLLRPAHLFAPLKQGNLESLKKTCDYFIQRQFENKEWSFNIDHPRRYDKLLEEVTKSFAKFTGFLDRNYIFAWMDWDGDNVLANAGIIDYGSIRQFGLRHDQYRYDDVERMSTNLNEQKKKARQIIQVFAQIVDFIKTGERKTFEHFSQDPSLTNFDKITELSIHDYFLYQMGLTETQRRLAMESRHALVADLYAKYFALETTKTSAKTRKVPDGINRPAIFNMRKGLQFLASDYDRKDPHCPNAKLFFKKILAQSTKGKDRRLTLNTKRKITAFLNAYYCLVGHVFGLNPVAASSQSWARRAQNINRQDRITGDGVLIVVDEIMRAKKRKKLTAAVIQEAIDNIISIQTEGVSWDGGRPSSQPAEDLTSKLMGLIDRESESI